MEHETRYVFQEDGHLSNINSPINNENIFLNQRKLPIFATISRHHWTAVKIKEFTNKNKANNITNIGNSMCEKQWQNYCLVFQILNFYLEKFIKHKFESPNEGL